MTDDHASPSPAPDTAPDTDDVAARPDPTAVEERASAALDHGTVLPPHDEAAHLLASMTEAVDRLRAAPTEVDADERDQRIAAALHVFDTLDLGEPPVPAATDPAGDPAAGAAVVPISAAGVGFRRDRGRHRTRRRLTAAAGAAATVAVALGVGRLATGGAGEQVAGGGAVVEVPTTADAKADESRQAVMSAPATDAATAAAPTADATDGAGAAEGVLSSGAPAGADAGGVEAPVAAPAAVGVPVDLGPVADTAALQDAAAPWTAVPPAGPTPAACSDTLARSGVAPGGEVVGSASVRWRDRPATVLFVRSPGSTDPAGATVLVVVDDACVPLVSTPAS